MAAPGGQIGATLAGDVAGDFLGSTSITALGNNNVVIASRLDDEGGVSDAGSVRLVDGITGGQIGATLAGNVANDNLGSSVTALNSNHFVVISAFDDEGGIVDAGTGSEIGTAIIGSVGNDFNQAEVIKPVSGNYYILSQRQADNGGFVDSGRVRIVVP